MAHAGRLQRADLRFLRACSCSDMFNCPSATSRFLSSCRGVLFLRRANIVRTVVLGGLPATQVAACERDDPFVHIHQRIIVQVRLDHVFIPVLCLVKKLGRGPLMFLKSLISYRTELLLRVLRVLIQLALSRCATLISSVSLSLVYSSENFFGRFVLHVLRLACFTLLSLSLISR